MVEATKLTVFVGRFSPFHNAHRRIVDVALGTSSHVAILVGSAFGPRSTRNPFTYEERVEMIRGSYDPEVAARLRFAGVPDTDYDDAGWIADVRSAVRGIQAELGTAATPDLIGHGKDGTSYYLRKFPGWGSVQVDAFDDGLSATHLREYLFKDVGADSHDFTLSQLAESAPRGTVRVVADMLGTPAWRGVCESVAKEAKDREPFAHMRFKPWFYTADAVVVRSGHVLMVRRANHPFKGLLALPGGFVDHDEAVEDAWIRELREETGIDVPDEVLQSHVVASREFSKPHRDPRGRMVTRATLVVLPDGPLPRVVGRDDAVEALWVPLEELRRGDVAFDHLGIVRCMRAEARRG